MNEDKLRQALRQIAQVANSAVNSPDDSDVDDDSNVGTGTETARVCTPKSLPLQLQVRAAMTARAENPANAPVVGFLPHDADIGRAIANPLNIALLTSKYWGPSRRTLTVSFMEPTSTELRKRILSHMNAWQCAIQFVLTQGTGQVRISRGSGGYWSYLGTDIQHISKSRQTMNLESFTMSTPESEYHRVIRHETGHTLGFPHEHMRRQIVALIDPQKAYPFFLRTQGWDKDTVDAQVLTPLDDASIMGTSPDQTSIMCYQLPGEITKNGQPIVGGTDINSTDRAFCLRIYPQAGAALHFDSHYDSSEFTEEPNNLEDARAAGAGAD